MIFAATENIDKPERKLEFTFMDIFDVGLEATVHVLTYDSSETLGYEEIEYLFRDENKIYFSLLIHVKQTKPVIKGEIQIFLVHILNDGSDGRQKYTKLHIGDISLCRTDADNSVDGYATLRADQWKSRQTYRWNVRDVPTQGCGSYAIVLLAGQDSIIKHGKILDCAYFKVI